MESVQHIAMSALRALTDDDPQQARHHIKSLSLQGRAVLGAWAEELSRLVRDEQTNYEVAERRAARGDVDRVPEDEARRRVREHLRHLRVTYGYTQVGPGDFVTVLSEVGRPRLWMTSRLEDMTGEGILSPDPANTGRYLIVSTP